MTVKLKMTVKMKVTVKNESDREKNENEKYPISLLLEWKVLWKVAKAKKRAQAKESRRRERFRKNIGDIIRGVHIGNVDIGVVDAFTNIMPTGVDMLRTRMETRIFC